MSVNHKRERGEARPRTRYRKEMGFVTVGGQTMLGHPRDDVFKISLKVREIRLTVNRFKKENIIGIENNSTVTRQWHTADGIHEDIELKIRGPKMEPCGTPEVTGMKSEETPSSTTRW